MIPERLRLRHLRTFVAIAERGSLVKAAQALSVTQPAVSKTLAELEDIVGQQLMERTKRGVKLTRPGQVLLRYAGSSLRTLREGFDSIGRVPGADAPAIVLGALPSFGSTILPRAIKNYLADTPQARVRVRPGSNAYLLSLLRQGELDFVLGRMADASEMRGLSFEHLYVEPLVLAVRAGHPLLSEPRLAAKVLLRYRLVLPDRGTRTREPADSFFVAAGLPLPDEVLETIDPLFARSYVMQTDAVWCAPAGVVENDFKLGSLARLSIDTEMTSGEVGLTMRADFTPSEALQRMFAEIRQAAIDR